MFRRRLDQTVFGLFCVAEHVQRAFLILTQSTRVFHSVDRQDGDDFGSVGVDQGHVRWWLQ